MFEATGAWLLPLIAALIHPFMGWCVQQAGKRGASQAVMVGCANVLTVIVFLAWFRPGLLIPQSAIDWLAVFAGTLFFAGQWFSIQSVKAGDIAVHSSAMGMKILMVAAMAISVGLEEPRFELLAAAVLACVAVFLVAGASLEGWLEHRKTVGLTLLACAFFAANDFLTGWKAQEIGVARFLVLMMLCSSLLSVGLLIWRRAKFVELVRKRKALGFVTAVGLMMGTQALLVTIAFGVFQQPTLSNVAYSTRGVMAVVFLWCIGQRSHGGKLARQLCGAVLMSVALVLAIA